MAEKLERQAVTAWARLLRAQRQLLEKVEGDLKAKGLPPLAWYDVLFELYQSPDKKLRQFEIGEKMLLSKFNLSRLIDRLEKDRLVRREPCAEDQRGAYVVLTQEGRKMLRKIWPTYAKALRECFADHYSKGELTTLSRLLARVC
jgi:DNA-binding MarR family transcriptional regulator